MSEVATPKHSRPQLAGGFGLDSLLAGALLLTGVIAFLALVAEPHTYTIYLTVHVVAALVWVGGNTTLVTLGIVFERRGDQEAMQVLARLASWIGPRVYAPASFIVFGFGVAMVREGQIGWGQFWVVFGLVGWAMTAATGLAFIGPQVKRIERAVELGNPDEVARHVRRLYAGARFDSAILLLIVLDMLTKPFS